MSPLSSFITLCVFSFPNEITTKAPCQALVDTNHQQKSMLLFEPTLFIDSQTAPFYDT
jgi:hypothetical protein